MKTTEANKPEITDITPTISNIKLNYIFSFAFSSIPMEEKLTETSIQSIGDLFCEKFKNDYSSLEFHLSEEKEPLNARSALYIKFPHLSIQTKRIEATFNPLSIDQGHYQCNIALFETGMGIMWVMLDFNQLKNTDLLYKIANRDFIPQVIDVGSDTIKTPYKIFYDEVSELKNKISTIYPDVEWENILWKDGDTNSYNRGKNIFQEPTIALILKSDDFLTLKERNTQKIKKFISSVLHGTDQESIDKSHCLNEECHDLFNLYPVNNFCVYFHSNCLLVIHNEEIKNNTTKIEDYNEFKKLTHGLFRTYCAIRGTWHLYCILNEQIDKSLNEIKGIFSKISTNTSTEMFPVFLEKMIKDKIKFLYILDSEDPFIRGIGLTPYNEIYKSCVSVYKLLELKEVIKYKLSEIDRLFNMINSYRFLKPLDKPNDSQRSVQWRSALPITVFILLSFGLLLYGSEQFLKYIGIIINPMLFKASFLIMIILAIIISFILFKRSHL